MSVFYAIYFLNNTSLDKRLARELPFSTSAVVRFAIPNGSLQCR